MKNSKVKYASVLKRRSNITERVPKKKEGLA